MHEVHTPLAVYTYADITNTRLISLITLVIYLSQNRSDPCGVVTRKGSWVLFGHRFGFEVPTDLNSRHPVTTKYSACFSKYVIFFLCLRCYILIRVEC